MDVAAALAFAHREGVIHRDIKTDNILFDDHGNAIVADFGIARALSGYTEQTGTNMVVGTPQYFSPEQARGLRRSTAAPTSTRSASRSSRPRPACCRSRATTGTRSRASTSRSLRRDPRAFNPALSRGDRARHSQVSREGSGRALSHGRRAAHGAHAAARPARARPTAIPRWSCRPRWPAWPCRPASRS